MHHKKGFLFVLLLLSCFISSSSLAQDRHMKDAVTENAGLFTAPKLVVGIVVDQMRYDYLTRFWAKFGENGFKRLVDGGFNCKNNHYNYAPTTTGPGHASVYSGTTPSSHGIIGNTWYDSTLERDVYCVADESFHSVGTGTEAGKASPQRMNVTTITDQLRLHTQMRGKVIALALKDRAAVLPGGHTANGAYWFGGGEEGNWITSSYYMAELPKWVQDFNSKRGVDRYKKPWNTLSDIHTYVESGPDNVPYEGLFQGEAAPVFPHDIPQLWQENGSYEILRTSPFGNNLTTDFALAAAEGEHLGEDTTTDFLAISYSSTDYVGHMYGVNSKEVEDMYIRLDKDLERLLSALDKQVGSGEYTVFLTADHAAVDVPAYLSDQKIPAGYFHAEEILTRLREFLKYRFGGAALIKSYSNDQLYLDHNVMRNLDLSEREVEEILARELLDYEPVERVYTAYQMRNTQFSHGIPYILQNGFNQKRSGDILIVMKPGFTGYMKTGTTHGTPHVYDTHVPLLFYGKGIRQGSTVSATEIPDIAATIAALLGIAFPDGATGNPIGMALE